MAKSKKQRNQKYADREKALTKRKFSKRLLGRQDKKPRSR
jgi:hypothetical protein